MSRRTLALAALAALVLLSGCAGFLGGGSVSDERLDEEPAQPYAWNASTDAHITVTKNATFRAVYRVNRSEVELFRRDGFGGRNALPVSALRYRYPNGTVVTGSEFDEHGGGVSKSRDSVTVALPTDGPRNESNATARLAFSSQSTPKRFALPTFVKGSYEVVLPEGRRVDFPLFGSVSPGGYETERVDGRTHIVWDNVERDSIVVQFYLQRDLTIFAGIAAVLVLVGVGGALYYRRQIEALKRRREELGLDVEMEDDDLGDDGPPRMR
ncbi:MAG: DUF5803 family protein [Haloferacaceae archaeon]